MYNENECTNACDRSRSFSSTQKTRVEKDQYLSELRSAYRNAQSQLGVELKKASDLQQVLQRPEPYSRTLSHTQD